MIKFGRTYKLTIQVSADEAIVVTPPLTIQFNIQRSVMATINSMTLQIYNLSPQHRNQIFQDRFNPRRFLIILEAGYENQTLSTIFKGDIFEANSTREGSNIITNIYARDGNFDVNQSYVGVSFEAGQTVRDIIQYLSGQFPNLKTGHITSNGGLDTPFQRPVVLSGNVYDIIKRYANMSVNQPYIDLEIVNVLGIDEVIANNNIVLIDSSTGLLNTPKRDQTFLQVTTLFEPRVIMGQLIELESKINPIYNGAYKVIGVNHKGTISGAVSGDCTSTFSLNGNQLIGAWKTV